MHDHRWIVFSGDVCTHTVTLYCRCGAVDEAQVVEAQTLAAVLDRAALETNGTTSCLPSPVGAEAGGSPWLSQPKKS